MIFETEDDPIAFTKTKLPFGWLGNMSKHAIGKFPTAEHVFQSMRLPEDHHAQADGLLEPNPLKAKWHYKKFADDFIVEPCSDKDVVNMRSVVGMKMIWHPQLMKALKETSQRTIIEDVTSRGDKGANLFWGARKIGMNKWEGANVLGNIWMDFRRTLISHGA